MKKLLLFLLVLLCVEPATADTEQSLERRVRRFYTYYYLNHYDDMWSVFHPDLRDRLGGDRKSYIRSQRQSELELFEANIRELRVRDGKGMAVVDLVFFYRGVGRPIPRRHRMYWSWEENRWWYMGSELTEGEAPIQGEDVAQAEPEQGVEAPSGAKAATTQPAPEEPPRVARPEPPPEPVAPPSAEEPVVAVAQVEPEPPAEVADAEPSGLPEEVADQVIPEDREPGDLHLKLKKLGAYNRQKKLERIRSELTADDIPDLLEAARTLSHPIRKWSLEQVAWLGVRYPEMRDEAVLGLSEFLVIVGTGLRETAARGVGMLRETGIREQLELLAGDTFPDVRLAVVRALGALADPRSAPALIRAWNQQNDAFTREAILESLGRTWSPEGAALLADVAGRRKNDIAERVAATRSIAFHAPAEALDTLRRLDTEFDDGPRALVWQLRTLTVAGRIRLEDPEALDALADLLEDERRVPDQPSGGERELGEMVARARNLEAGRILLENPKAGPRYAGAIAVREMARHGVEGAAELGRKAAGGETSQIVAVTLSGI